MKDLLGLLLRFQWKDLFYTETNNGWIQLFRYGFIGGTAFVVDFSVYCILEHDGMYYPLAAAASFVAGFAFNFFLSRRLIFYANVDEHPKKKELLSVLTISIIGLILTEFFLVIGTDLLKMNNQIAKIVASILVLFWNYAARKVFVYR